MRKCFVMKGKAGVVFPQGYDADRRPLTVALSVAVTVVRTVHLHKGSMDVVATK